MRRFAVGVVVWLFALASGVAAELTPLEQRWLRGAAPVVSWAREQGMPLDVIVQPQAADGLPPLALAFVGGRCKLVFSMRGNPEAEATLARIEPALLGPALELMAAHELGHCRRWLDGAWNGVPAGFTPVLPDGLSPDLERAWAGISAARREEGYGDLVGLAWTARRHPRDYAALHAWLSAERLRERVPGSPHDTLAWVRRAGDARTLVGLSLFDGPTALWAEGLQDD